MVSIGVTPQTPGSILRCGLLWCCISLFNVGGGGALQKDIRSLGDIGGFRGSNVATYGDPGYQDFDFTGAFALLGTDTISFNLLVDGSSSYTVTVDEATINAALSKVDGTVSNDAEFADVLRYAFGTINDVARAFLRFNGVRIQSVEATESSNSSIEISGVTSNFGSGNFGLDLRTARPRSLRTIIHNGVSAFQPHSPSIAMSNSASTFRWGAIRPRPSPSPGIWWIRRSARPTVKSHPPPTWRHCWTTRLTAKGST